MLARDGDRSQVAPPAYARAVGPGGTPCPRVALLSEDCAICQMEMPGEHLVVGLSCGHFYHRPCIAECAQRIDHPSCPQCRRPIHVAELEALRAERGASEVLEMGLTASAPR